MKILLVNPAVPSDSGRDLYTVDLGAALFTFRTKAQIRLGIPPALPTLAALTPADHEVKIVDEEVENVAFDESWDLVGITSMTYKARRAYEIAREFRVHGIPVIMGGIHASVRPEEVAKHVDSVVIGEAEELWPKILEETEKGMLQKMYKAESLPDLKKSPIPRYDLVKRTNYVYTYLQTTRGCPFDCLFCTVTKFNGKKIRKKTPEQVIAEVDSFFRLNPEGLTFVRDRRDGKRKKLMDRVAFIDDNFAIDREHALEICRRLQRYQEEHQIILSWYTQLNYMVGFDGELLEAMEAANCRQVLIGFESLDPSSLKAMRKTMNIPQTYGEAIQNIQSHGIHVIFSVILGDEHTSTSTVAQIVEFVEKNGVFHVLPNILTPFPGTGLHEQMRKENRIRIEDPTCYNIRNVVYEPKTMSPLQLQQTYTMLCNRVFQYDKALDRGKKLLCNSDPLRFPLLYRLVIWLGVSITAIRLMLQKRLRPNILTRVLKTAPGTILIQGSISSLEVLCLSVDWDDFAYSETKRLPLSPAAMSGVQINNSIK
jgi:radical SAM superfamily enzyme YgiQ (UPF0313 family)